MSKGFWTLKPNSHKYDAILIDSSIFDVDVFEFDKDTIVLHFQLVQNSRCHLDGYDFDNGEEDYGHITVADIYSKIPQVNFSISVTIQ